MPAAAAFFLAARHRRRCPVSGNASYGAGLIFRLQYQDVQSHEADFVRLAAPKLDEDDRWLKK
jgi:hypothetical protein